MSDSNHMGAFGDFGKWVPGFEFLKGLSQPAGSKAVPQMPGLGSWVAPTVSVEELDKRTQELKTVLFWLEQNATALKATIQALEVQKMTLATLQGMNVSLQDMAKAFSVPTPGPAQASAASQASDPGFAGLEVPPVRAGKPSSGPRKAASPKAAPEAAAGAQTPGLVDPLQWWGALTQQFQTIAETAVQEAKARAPQMPPAMKAATDLAEQASRSMAASAHQALDQARQSGARAGRGAAPSGAKSAAAQPPSKPRAAPPRKRAAASQRSR